MTAESLFSLAGMAVLPGWFLLVFLPRWKYGPRLIAAVVIPGVLALLYTWLVLAHAGGEGGFGSLAQVRRLFENDHLLLAGWVHYLAFDLFIGSWQVRDAQRAGVHHLAVVPCLLLTFLFGPVGLLVYLVIRVARARSAQLGHAG